MFDAFWPTYLEKHRSPLTRIAHFVGTVGALGILSAAVVQKKLILVPCAVVVGYGCAWFGHFFWEKNRPATFDHPWLSFRADLKLLGLMLRGKLWTNRDDLNQP